MKKKHRARFCRIFALSFLVFSALCGEKASGKDGRDLFAGLEKKEAFAREISYLIEKAWKNWQDSVTINDIYVDGSQGVLSAGDIKGPVLTASSILANFDRKGKSQDYIDCVRAVAGAVESGMRSWQRGYTHSNISFPRGASCTITLPPTENVPVSVASGRSPGDRAMRETALYNYMLYRAPLQEKDVLVVLKGSAKAISECFKEWKDSCSIAGIIAGGGVAPQPAPMGPGPGLVRGAKGKGGKLKGAYFDGDCMYREMVGYFKTRN
jgi:hypothetical protein